jgi:hypothetical protein
VGKGKAMSRWTVGLLIAISAATGGATAILSRRAPQPPVPLCISSSRPVLPISDFEPSEGKAIRGMAYGDGHLVAVGRSSTVDGSVVPAIWANDGSGWEEVRGGGLAQLTGGGLEDVAWGGSRWLAVGYRRGPSGPVLLSSTNTLNWELVPSQGFESQPRSTLYTIAWNDDEWLVGGSSYTGYEMATWRSVDGEDWERGRPRDARGRPILGRSFRDMVAVQGEWFGLGGFTYTRHGETVIRIWASADGQHWTSYADVSLDNILDGIASVGGQLLGVGTDKIYQLSPSHEWLEVAHTPRLADSRYAFLRSLAFDGNKIFAGGVIGEGSPGHVPEPRTLSGAAGIWSMELASCTQDLNGDDPNDEN